MDTKRLAEVTGRTLEQWTAELDALGCQEEDHATTARRIPAMLPNGVENKGWWAQSVTVEYEKAIGRRVVGQTCEGDFQLSVSRSFHGSRDEAIAAWQRVVQDMSEVDGVALATEPAITRTEKWCRWRVRLADGSRVVAQCYDKPTPDGTARAAFSVTHEKLADAEAVEHWRAVWKPLLGRM
ncbi:hypothetical protein [Luteococcus peritonei]|uniref:DUF4287 domain-containing protein n=1 Tax=Luteococcus peritonei TaxID=88874 RepID=A0ABW4S0M5_9ACTN